MDKPTSKLPYNGIIQIYTLMENEQSKARNYWQREKDFTPKFQGEFKVGARVTYAGE